MNTNKKTVQTLPGELFDFFERSNHPRSKEKFLVVNGLPCALTPAVILPLALYGMKMSIGVHAGYDVMTFYLFDNPVPHETKRCSLLLESSGGQMVGMPTNQKYRNVLLTRQVQDNLVRIEMEDGRPVKKNYHLPISLVQGEIGRLISSDLYSLEEFINRENIRKLTPFVQEDFQRVIDPYATVCSS